MYRIGIVSSESSRDWASGKLLKAANKLAEGRLVDPISFGMSMNGKPLIQVQSELIDSFDAFIVRGFNRSGEIDYQYEIFQLLEQRGKLVVNSPAALSVAESKAQTTYLLQQAGLPVPRTIVTQNLSEAVSAVNLFGTAVVKPLYGSFGIDIEKLSAENGEEFLSEFLDRHGVAYIQEYIPNDGRDIRAFVVGDDVPAAMYRIAHEGQWKTNVYQGSSCESCVLSIELREMSLTAAKTIGLDYTGVDIVEGPDGPVILEVNGAPYWHGLADTTNRNMAEDIVRHVLCTLSAGQSARQPSALMEQQRMCLNRTCIDSGNSL